MLIDFSQDDFTAATAAPEVLAGLCASQLPSGEIVYALPEQDGKGEKKRGRVRDWPKRAREMAEVYSLGRTVNILCNGVSMTELYMRLYEDAGYEYRTEWVGRIGGREGRWIRRIVEGCCAEDPRERLGFEELEKMCEELESGGICGLRMGWRGRGCVIS